jgi:hypothetical protein
MVNTQIDQRTSHKVRETRSLENLKLLTICLLTASIVVCYQDVYTATFRKHRFRSLVRTQRLKCETGSQLLGPFRTAVSHFRRFAFRVSLSQFRDALQITAMLKLATVPLDLPGHSVAYVSYVRFVKICKKKLHVCLD